MNKKDLFKEAHRITREFCKGFDYSATFSITLKLLYKGWKAKMSYTRETLEKIGGSYWEKGEMHRVYFNDLAELIGLTFGRYNTGNISWAKIDGEKISNSECKRLLARLNGKFFYDFNDNSFKTKDIGYKVDELIKGVDEKIAAL